MILDDIKSATNWNRAVTPEQKVLIALCFYATGTIEQCMGNLQGFDKSTVSRAVKCVCFYRFITQSIYKNARNPRRANEENEGILYFTIPQVHGSFGLYT